MVLVAILVSRIETGRSYGANPCDQGVIYKCNPSMWAERGLSITNFVHENYVGREESSE